MPTIDRVTRVGGVCFADSVRWLILLPAKARRLHETIHRYVVAKIFGGSSGAVVAGALNQE